MPIRPYLAGRTFAPETIAAMSSALNEVCKALQIVDFGPRKMVAQTIIALVEKGQTDSDQLIAMAIDEIRGTNSATGTASLGP
jgi:hypothetical protein